MTKFSSPSGYPVSEAKPAAAPSPVVPEAAAGNLFEIFTDEQKKKFAAQDALYNETMRDG